jgi:hypothetical protein
MQRTKSETKEKRIERNKGGTKMKQQRELEKVLREIHKWGF